MGLYNTSHQAMSSHLSFDLAMQRFQFLHISFLGWPSNTQSFLFIWLRNLQQVSIAPAETGSEIHTTWKWTWKARVIIGALSIGTQTYVVHDLMSQPPVVLQQIIVLQSARCCYLLRHRLPVVSFPSYQAPSIPSTMR
jgi:hypothetical protein